MHRKYIITSKINYINMQEKIRQGKNGIKNEGDK